MNFHQLINVLAKEQRVYKSPHVTEKLLDNYQTLDYFFQSIKYQDQHNEFELIPSFKKEESILITIINALFQYPAHQFEHHLSELKNYICHWMIIYRDIMLDYNLNSSKINSYLANRLDHEDQILLLALIFRINIIVIDIDLQYRLYSPISIGHMYVIFFQHSNLQYSAIKFKPSNKQALSNLTGFISIVEPNHPLIVKLIGQLSDPILS